MTELWLSITEAAFRLSSKGDPLDRSTLSRYLKQHALAIPQRRDGKYSLVEFQSLLLHRQENIRIKDLAAPSPLRIRRSIMGPRDEGVARRVQAVAEMREMDLVERRADLTLVGEVIEAKRDAIAMMVGAFEEATRTEKVALSLKFGWPQPALGDALAAFSSIGIEVFRNELIAVRYMDVGESDE